MPLLLTDHRWSELRSSYGDTGDVVTWLTEAYEKKVLSDERLGDIINEVQHQGGTSTAMYAVAIHLITLAKQALSEDALALLTHAGIIYANAARSDAVPCPDFLQGEFESSAPIGAKSLAPLLVGVKDFDTYKWAVAGLAGFIGQQRFARFLDGLEYFEGRFEHALLDKPFPPDI